MSFRRCLERGLASLVLLCGAAAAEPELLLVELQVNGQPAGQEFVLRADDGQFLIPQSALEAWRIHASATATTLHRGRSYVRLDALDGASAVLDARRLLLDIRLPPQLFAASTLSLARRGAAVPEAGRGAFLDYDATLYDEGSGIGPAFSGLLQPSLFAGELFVTSAHVYTAAADSKATAAAANCWLRLETALGRDDVDNLRSWRLGDAVTAGGHWGRGVRFGGLQLGTNFATQPELVPFPLPSIAGETSVPSAIEIYVNNSLAAHSEVPAGAFSIDHVPAVTGAGQVRLVVRDLLGREQVFVQDFYASSRLLRDGLTEYSLNVGWLRERFGIDSDDYGDLVSVGQYRHGFSDRATGEFRAELGAGLIGAGTSFSRALGDSGVLSAGLALSTSDAGSGALWLLGYEFQAQRFRVNGRLQGRDDAHVQLGFGSAQDTPKLELATSGGVNFGAAGSLGIALVAQRLRGGADRQLLSLHYGRTFSRSLAFSAVASYAGGSRSELGFGLYLSRSFGGRRSAGIGFSRHGDRDELRLQQRYDPLVGPGFGYRVSASMLDESALEADLTAKSRIGRHSLESRYRDGRYAWRASSAGSLVALSDSGLFAAREIGDAFAVAEVGDYADVRVYLENLEIGRTDAQGRVLLPRLRPYERNRVRIEQADLPLEARVERLELTLTPRSRSGLHALFPVRPARDLVLRVVDAAGLPLPSGALAGLDGSAETFPVGRDGLLYLSDIAPGSRLRIEWVGGGCTLQLPAEFGAGPLPRLGSMMCR